MAAVSQVQFPDINITIMPFFYCVAISWPLLRDWREALYSYKHFRSQQKFWHTYSFHLQISFCHCVCINTFSHIFGGFFTWRIGRWCCATPVCKLLNTGIIISCFSPTAIFGEMSGGDSNYCFVHRRGCIQKSSSIPPAKIVRTWIGLQTFNNPYIVFATFKL